MTGGRGRVGGGGDLRKETVASFSGRAVAGHHG